MEVLVFWLGFCVLVGYFANKKGRNGFGWFLLAFVISPLFAGIALAMASDKMVHQKIENVERKTDNLGAEMKYNQKYNDLRADLVNKQLDTYAQTIQPSRLQSSSNHAQQLVGIIACHSCGKSYNQSAKFCPYCGVTNSLFTKCSKCGNISQSDSVFCPNCGQQLRQILSCSNCGYQSEIADQAFCPNCGNKLKAMERLSADQSIPSTATSTRSVKIDCPSCHTSEQIDFLKLKDPASYSNFSATYNSFLGCINLVCNNCEKKFKIEPQTIK